MTKAFLYWPENAIRQARGTEKTRRYHARLNDPAGDEKTAWPARNQSPIVFTASGGETGAAFFMAATA